MFLGITVRVVLFIYGRRGRGLLCLIPVIFLMIYLGFRGNFEFLGCVCFRFVIIRSTMDVDKEFFAESSGCLQLVFFVDKYSIDDTIL